MDERKRRNSDAVRVMRAGVQASRLLFPSKLIASLLIPTPLRAILTSKRYSPLVVSPGSRNHDQAPVTHCYSSYNRPTFCYTDQLFAIRWRQS